MELKRVAVVGAAGKMGRGIALCFLQEMAFKKEAVLILNDLKLGNLKSYLRKGLRRFGEKNIQRLRDYYKENRDLVSNGEIIQAYVDQGLDVCWFGPPEGELIVEAIVEDEEAKIALFKRLPKDALVLTNTSSIPIHLLAKKSGLEGRLIGFHFYNPPPVQKLVELVASKELLSQAEALAKQLGKTVVYSADVPGFIGNGHFIRELAYACQLLAGYSVDIIDTMTKEDLQRPMGIFQLAQFVGIDVCEQIGKVMEIPLDLSFLKEWKPTLISGESQRELANEYRQESAKIAHLLVETKVAKSLEDVGTVLKLGFHHKNLPWEWTE